jgi:hypothetical protein
MTSSSSPPPALDLSRQVRTLLLTRPLFDLAAKTRRAESGDIPWAGVDSNYLALSLLVFVMDGAALGPGRTRAEILEHVATGVRQMKPQVSSANAHTMASVVLDTLHNCDNGTEEFSYSYYDANTDSMAECRFFLLRYERGAHSDEYFYRVSEEGFLVYLGMLDFGAADMQTLMEKMLQEFIARGNVDQALDAATRAYHQGSRYFSEISQTLLQAHRMPEQVRWATDIEPKLEHARTHIDGRLAEEHQLLQATARAMEDADASARSKFSRLRGVLEGGQANNSKLLTLVGSAGRTFRDANTRLFRARRRDRLPNLEDNVLPQLLQRTVAELDSISEEQGHVLFAPESPRIYSLDLLNTALLDSHREDKRIEADDGEQEPLVEPAPAFSAADILAARAFLEKHFKSNHQTNVALALKAAETEGHGHAVQDYVTYLLYESLSKEESKFPVTATPGARFDSARVTGTNISFTYQDTNEVRDLTH